MKNNIITVILSGNALCCIAWTDNGKMPNNGNNNPHTEFTIQMTTPVPTEYFSPATEQGKVERIEYSSKDYTGSMQTTTKPAYVYLPYGYDASQKYDIIYLIHGWTGTAETNFGWTNGRLITLFDNLIQRGKCKPFIAVSPTWDKDNRAKSWGESCDEVAVFYNEYKNDLIPAVEGRYGTYAETTDEAGIVASREHRAFGGFSLGSITTWYEFENGLNLQKWYLPMSGDSWLAGVFGGQSQPEKTAQMLADIVNASAYSGNGFYVWYAVGTDDSRFYQTHNQALAMAALPETFNETNFFVSSKTGWRSRLQRRSGVYLSRIAFLFPEVERSEADFALRFGALRRRGFYKQKVLLKIEPSKNHFRFFKLTKNKKTKWFFAAKSAKNLQRKGTSALLLQNPC